MNIEIFVEDAVYVGILPLHTDPERRIFGESTAQHLLSLAKHVKLLELPCHAVCCTLRSMPRLMQHPQSIIKRGNQFPASISEERVVIIGMH